MLAYYQSLVKKEELLNKISDECSDAGDNARELSEYLGNISDFISAGSIVESLRGLTEAEELAKELVAKAFNLKQNLISYISTLVPSEKLKETKEPEPQKEEPQTSSEEKNSLSRLTDTVNTLKELQASLNEKR